MPPLTPTSSQEIIPISPPPSSQLPKKRKLSPTTSSTTLPTPVSFVTPPELRERARKAVRDYEEKSDIMEGRDKRHPKREEVTKHRENLGGMERSRVTEVMMSTLGKGVNPITNSDLYSRTDHFVSAATGHQQSNRGGGSGGAATYWEVRGAKMIDQAREKKTDILKGCVFYINGSTGPRMSNLQLQHMITANGGSFRAVQSSSCTHIVANGGLSGRKTQKYLNGQGGRGASKRAKVVKIEWVIDSVEKGMRLSEAGYGVIEHPGQETLFKTLGVKPKLESELRIEQDEVAKGSQFVDPAIESRVYTPHQTPHLDLSVKHRRS